MADLIGDLAAPYALIMRRGRAIADIIPDVVVSERHRDTLAITSHPVETGADISDHAYLLPAECEMYCGFSDSTGGVGYSQEAYDALLALQAERQPFDVSSGKRLYSNMLVRSLAVQTDKETENVLSVTVSLREIRMTSAVGGNQAAVPNSAQASPQTTGAIQKSGEVTPTRIDAGSTIIPGLA